MPTIRTQSWVTASLLHKCVCRYPKFPLGLCSSARITFRAQGGIEIRALETSTRKRLSMQEPDATLQVSKARI